MRGGKLAQTKCGADLFNAHFADIRAAVAYVARKNRLGPDEREELTGLAYLKLVDRDYAVFRKFAGRASLRRYLIVMQRLVLDDRIRRWGKWRPSRRTRRQGPAAMLLDRLIVREGVDADRACSLVRSAYGCGAAGNLDEIAGELTPRLRRYHVDDAILEAVPCHRPGTDRFITAAERRRTIRRTATVLANAFEILPVDDRLILQLRFVENLTIRDIARRLAIPDAGSKHLYSRIQRQLTSLRAALEHAGLNRTDILEGIGAPDTPPIPVFTAVRPAPHQHPFSGGQHL